MFLISKCLATINSYIFEKNLSNAVKFFWNSTAVVYQTITEYIKLSKLSLPNIFHISLNKFGIFTLVLQLGPSPQDALRE